MLNAHDGKPEAVTGASKKEALAEIV